MSNTPLGFLPQYQSSNLGYPTNQSSSSMQGQGIIPQSNSSQGWTPQQNQGQNYGWSQTPNQGQGWSQTPNPQVYQPVQPPIYNPIPYQGCSFGQPWGWNQSSYCPPQYSHHGYHHTCGSHCGR